MPESSSCIFEAHKKWIMERDGQLTEVDHCILLDERYKYDACVMPVKERPTQWMPLIVTYGHLPRL